MTEYIIKINQTGTLDEVSCGANNTNAVEINLLLGLKETQTDRQITEAFYILNQ